MHIRSLYIANFRAIRFVQLENLNQAVVIAGPNGCGKSSIFDAVRLLKSAYGEYNAHEYQSFFQEFQVNVQRLTQESHRFFHNPEQPLRIRVEFELAEYERIYLVENGRALLSRLLWAGERGSRYHAAIDEIPVIDPITRRTKKSEIDGQTEQMFRDLMGALKEQRHVGELTMNPGGELLVGESPVIELIFNVYQPRDLGVIDYHGPNRNYIREQLGGISLDIGDPDQRHRQHALYNTENKYRNVKAEMAGSYIRQLVAEKAGLKSEEGSDLHDTLSELFDVFFPGKKFLGPTPTKAGGLSFPVKLENNRIHDIDDLSSGEKEVLLGYLRLRSNAPHNSIILLDEPELHLNPRLTKGLPRFYQKHLGSALNNQLWLITHSDALLREAVEEPAYGVFHMQAAHAIGESENQAIPVSASGEIERALISLVGDLATYSPRAKVVILEGGGESKFDQTLLEQLFPVFSERVNLVSGGNKYGVKALQVLFDKAAEAGKLEARFYSIVDKDFDGPQLVSENNQYSWDVYHVENYLLHPEFILSALKTVNLARPNLTVEQIRDMLQECARQTINDLLKIRLNSWVHEKLIGCISTRFDPSIDMTDGFYEAACRSSRKIANLLETILTADEIGDFRKKVHDELASAIDSDDWLRLYRGRDILNRFVGQHVHGTNYEAFRNVIVNRMRESGYQPNGMKSIIAQILAT